MLKTRGIAAKIVKKYLCNTAAIAAIAAMCVTLRRQDSKIVNYSSFSPTNAIA
jgi:hypothetical protein